MDGDLISRSAMQEVLDETDWYHISEDGKLVWGAHSEDDGLYRVRDICDALKEATAIDAVEVVRCWDCKHFTEGMAVGMCKRVTDKPVLPIPHNHFCSYGERREENGC